MWTPLSSTTAVINRTSPDHRHLEADPNREGNPKPEAAKRAAPPPGRVKGPVQDPGPAPCPGRGLDPRAAPHHVPAPRPVPSPVPGLTREGQAQPAQARTPHPG
ncbi:hypothetical protein MTO96_022877 [Rhipicephalus appendiculatus]